MGTKEVREVMEKKIQSIYEETQDFKRRVSINYETMKRMREVINELQDDAESKVFVPRKHVTLQGMIAKIIRERCNEVLSIEDIFKQVKTVIPDFKRQTINPIMTSLCKSGMAVKVSWGKYQYGFVNKKDIKEEDGFVIHAK